MHGHIIVAFVDNELTIKYLYQKNGRMRLEAANPSFLPIIPREGSTIQVFGVSKTTFMALPGFSI